VKREELSILNSVSDEEARARADSIRHDHRREEYLRHVRRRQDRTTLGPAAVRGPDADSPRTRATPPAGSSDRL